MTCPTVILAAMALAAGPAGGAAAQEPVRETVVVTANASPVPWEQVSRSITVLTRAQIEQLPVGSIAEALRLAAGVDVRARGPLGVQTDFALRGAGFGQTVVLVNGVRINDAQSGHHNGDIPVRLEDVERIEVLYGPGSSLYGADAFGGAINIITRRPATGGTASAEAGGFGTAAATAGAAFTAGAARVGLGVEASRSSGFIDDRDFRTVVASASVDAGRTRLGVSGFDKAFGAAGFYGPAPSREWTSGALVTLEQGLADSARWRASTTLAWRTHGDRFDYDRRQPGRYENRHRTHGVTAAFRARRTWSAATTLTGGAEAGGDWIRSSNLGDHAEGRAGVFVELQRTAGSRLVLQPGLRFDAYSAFGSAWSPSFAVAWWASPSVKLRASTGRAFRVPTYTERFYQDPNHLATPSLRPERAWSVDAGMDWVGGPALVLSATVFERHERDVIDWVRPSPDVRWRTTNIRQVKTRGLELGLRRAWAAARLDLQYARLGSDAGDLGQLSKYVLDFARDRATASAVVPLGWRLALGPRVEYTRRADGRDYLLVDARIGRRAGRIEVYVEGSNLLDVSYEEITGVAMPGRWAGAGLGVRW